MHIYFKRSGGFMGRTLQAELDTQSLPAEEAAALEQLLMEATLHASPSVPAEVSEIDCFTYELTVVKEDKEQTIYFSEQAAATAEVNDLLRRLTLIARRPPDLSSSSGANSQ